MGVIRAEPARVSDWASKSVGAAWRAFDLQLTTYAGLLVAIGLVMAYTNSVEGGSVVLQAGTTFSRGLMWAGIFIVSRNNWVVAAHHCCWNATIFALGLPLSGAEDWRAKAPSIGTFRRRRFARMWRRRSRAGRR